MTTRHDAQPQNQLLAALPASELSLLRPQLKRVSLDQGAVLQDPDERVQYVYFPISGMISLLAVMSDGKAVETSAVGREGALGLHCGFGIFHVHTRAVVEIPGVGFRIPAGPFQKFVRESERLRDLLTRYREFRLAETQQSVACNALHAAEGRLARWLLHSSDIIGSDILPLTQEFLSQVLGVRRTTVTTLARNLLRTGVIRYSRGRIEIRDREQLKNFACECYEVLHRLPAQILPRPKR
jgi:CRP-like cAMP-binding protein